MYGPQGILGSVTRDRQRSVAYLREAFVHAIAADNLVYRGLAGHLLPTTLKNVLRVCLAATPEYRVEQAVAAGISHRAASREVENDDSARADWTQLLLERGPWDKELYDIFLPMHTTSIEDAIDTICTFAAKPVVATTPLTQAALADAQLAATVEVQLVEAGHDVEVTCSKGAVTVLINKHTLFFDRLSRELVEAAEAVPGVVSATAKPGPKYKEPNIYVNLDVGVPSKVLLVDDEEEFVHTLSERLQTRQMAPAIAYNGEQALEMAAAEEPEVMVLDLKMPGIDGIEVLRRVKKRHPATEVIILTGHGSDAEEKLANELGAFAYLRKPVDIDLLTQTMKDAYSKVNAARGQQDQKAE
jgi:CheY-like chemotaxis protein